MKSMTNLLAAGALTLAAILAPGAQAGSLLGTVSTVLGGSNGSVGGVLNTGNGSIGVEGVATIDLHTSGDNTTAGLTVLGGGTDVHSGLGGLLGSSGGLNVGLPDLGGTLDLLGGKDGKDGKDGKNGTNGGGYPVVYYAYGNGGGGRYAIPGGISARLKLLLKILEERDWLQLSNGRAVCLPAFGTASVTGWLPQKDWATFQKVLPAYMADIAMLRQLLGNCRSAGQQKALGTAALNRVIGIDVRPDGSPVVFML